MEDNVRKELDTIKSMVNNWKNGYIGLMTGDPSDKYLVDDFLEELNVTYVYPYACRLRDAMHITSEELSIFMGECYEYVFELKDIIEKAGKNDGE